MTDSGTSARRGSQRLLQEAVEYVPDDLLRSLRDAGALTRDETVTWVSPIRDDDFREYRDRDFIDKLGLADRLSVPLASFWPRSGPRWDALGTTSTGRPVLVEAKAHIAEAASPGSTATAASSIALIGASLETTRRFIAPRSTASWTGTFYQYTNRLAHQYYLRELNGIDSVLIFLNFLNATEMNGPTTVEEWNGAVRLMHTLLKLPGDLESFGVYHACMDAKRIPESA